ncbi:MAG: ISAs1 family transposase [Hyphomicrobiaceae bacterium]|nr:ISAs1 family transposase [Hyphomicrobiaceae bacterium]
MPCTAKKTFEAARGEKCHLLVQVKDNQKNLLKDIEKTVVAKEPKEAFESVDKGKRSRHETRTVEIFDAPETFRDKEWNELIASIVRITRITLKRSAKSGTWKRSEEISFYACSASISAKKAASAVRGHWGIENRNHYVRDVSMLEDASRIRINPGIFARARSFALNILRANGEQNIADALWNNGLNFKRLLQYRYK